MILKQTDDYIFRLGSKSRIVLWNVTERRYEIWIGTEPGEGELIWCYYEISMWYTFDRVAVDGDIVGNSVIRLNNNNEISLGF